MAAIASVTGSGSVGTTLAWDSTATWQGGVVPTSSDDVTIAGFRTTINQTAISKWTSGTITITVASTTGFPSSGYFFTGTNWGEVLKVNYTGTTATTFTGCTLDLTDPFYEWNITTNSNIPNTQYVHSPAPIINIASGVTGSCSTLLVTTGGRLNIAAGGILRAYNYITHRDGRIVGRGAAGSIGKIQITRTEPNIGYYTAEDYKMAILDLDGGETRTYAATSANIAIGGTSVTIGSATNGSFAVGDEISIYDAGFGTKGRRPRVVTFRDATEDFRGMDEGFDVVGVSGSTIYLGRRNGARGTIKQSATSGSQKILTVDKNDHLSQMQFKAGDKVVINNASYTIDAVADSEYQIASYNFQTGSTLTDFLIDDISAEDAWSTDSYGAYATDTNFNALVNKNIWRREMVMEVEMSPLSQYTTGTRGTDQFGLLFNYDPSWRKGHRTQTDSVKTGFMKINDGADTMLICERGTGASDWMNMSRDTAGLKTLVQAARTYKLDMRNNIIKIYIDGEQMYERFQTNGSMRGLFGAYVWNNTSARVKRITYKAPTQDLYITTTDSFTDGHVVYESGAENAHASGRRMLKLASKITNIEGHDDLAFAYRGAYEAGVWPAVRGINADSGTNASATWAINHDMAIDYYWDMGTTANRFATFDLTKQRTFTHVSFTPRTEEMGSLPSMVGVTIYGSNDGTTWTTIYATATDTKKYQNGQWYNQMGFYSVGSQSYRYVKFLTNGHNGTLNTTYNRWVNVGVHDFTNGYKITVNNASDFVVGDIISVMCHNAWYSIDDSQTYTAVKAAQNPDTYLHTPNTHATITAISGNTITLDKQVNWGYLEGGETVVKVNRNFRVEGLISKDNGTLWQKPYFRYNGGASTPKVYWLTNVYFENVGSSRVSSSNWNRGIDLSQQDYNNPAIVDGCSIECYNGSGANGLTFQSGTGIVRNSYVANVYEYRPAYNASYCGVATFNNKMHNIYRTYLENFRNGMFNYNEVASTYQLYIIEGIGYDLNVSVGPSEYRRNSMHGCREVPGFFATGYSITGGITPIIDNEYNRVYATNGASFTQRPAPGVVSAYGWDIHAEHPGQRLTQYRSEGFTGWWNSADASDAYSGIMDFQRADYDFVLTGLYHHMVRFKNADYIRAYMPSADGQLGMFSLRAYRTAAVAMKIYVEFDYRHPMRYNRIQNGNWDYSTFRVGVVHNGVYVTNAPQYTTNPATINSDLWQKFTYTFDAIPTEAGTTSLFIGRGANTTFADIRNVRAYIMTDNPESVTVINNTCDINKLFNIVNDKKDIRPISAATPLKVRRLKI